MYKGWSPEYLAHAREIFERALALDPKNVEAMVWMAVVDLLVGTSYMIDGRAALLATAEATSVKVLSLAPNHAFAHLILGNLLIHTNRAAQGIAECERALALDRNLAVAHGTIGFGKLCLGRGAETEAHIEQALRLSPRDAYVYTWTVIVGLAKFWHGANAEAIVWLRRSLEAT